MDGQKIVFKFLNQIIEREIGPRNSVKVTELLMELEQAELNSLCSDADLMLAKIKECEKTVKAAAKAK